MLNLKFSKKKNYVLFCCSQIINQKKKFLLNIKNVNYKILNKFKSNNLQPTNSIPSQHMFNFNTFIKFFSDKIMKHNFNIFILSNIINNNFFISFVFFLNYGIKSRFFRFRYNFSNFFYFNLFTFFYFRNANIILNFLVLFVNNFKYKFQRLLNTMLVSLFVCIPVKVINKYGLAGCQIKIKGKYTQRPGDRRKVYFYKLGSFSISDNLSKYNISHRQLKDKSGSSGCTVITLLYLMYINLLKQHIVIGYITLYFLNLIVLMIFFFFTYYDKYETLYSKEYTKKNYYIILIFWSMFIAGVPPFVSFLVKFFLFSASELSGAIIFINLGLILIINIYTFWYVYHYYSYYILSNYKTNMIKTFKSVDRDVFSEKIYALTVLTVQVLYIFIHHFLIF